MHVKRKTVLTMAAAVVLVLAAAFGLAWGMISRSTRLEPIDLTGVTITPQMGNALSMELESGFLISGGELTQEQVEDYLTITPETGYTVTPSEEGYLVLPSQPLEEDTLYSLTLGDARVQTPRSWAFQTKRPVGIRSSYPTHGSTYVPVDGGLEFTLSHLDLDISDHFSIDPPVEGSWEKHNSLQVFLPSQPLEPGTLYTVTISPGASCSAGTMEEPVMIRFRTNDDGGDEGWQISLPYNRLSESFLPRDPVILEVEAYNRDDREGQLGQGQVAIYRLQDGEEYLSLLEKHQTQVEEQLLDESDYVEDLSGREPSLRFGALFHATDSSYLCTLPEGAQLGNGFYLAQMTFRDGGQEYQIQKFFQISPVASYVQSHGNEALVWLNDAAAGQPLAGATVETADNASFAGSYYATTDENGLAQFTTYGDGAGYLRVVQNGQVVFADRYRPYAGDGEEGEDTIPLEHRFFSMVYTDRTLYQPTDSIRVWGFLSPRKGETQPASVTVRLKHWGEESPVLASQTVAVGEDGSFSAQLDFADVQSSSYYVELVNEGGEAYATTTVSVEAYRKPSYLLSTSCDRAWYGPGDSARIGVQSTFFDGTPVPGMGFSVEGYQLGNASQLTTGQDGSGSVRVTLPLYDSEESPNSCDPFYVYATISNTDAQNQSVYTDLYLQVLPRSVILDVQAAEDGSGRVTVTTHRTDPSAIEAEGPSTQYRYYSLDDVKGEAVDLPVTVTVMQVDQIAQQTGEEYDFISGTVVPTYTYTQQETVAQVWNLRTQDGQLVLEELDQYQPAENRYYYLVVSCTDLDNRPVEESFYLGGSAPDRWGPFDAYALAPDAGAVESPYYVSSMEIGRGETVTLSLFRNGSPARNEGRILWTSYQDRVTQVQVTDQSTVQIAMDDARLPNAYQAGAYFDGKHLYRVLMPTIQLEKDSVRGTVTVTADQETYSPGEEAALELLATGPDGAPLANASYVISVADEAVFSLSPQDYDGAADLYTQFYYDDPVIQVSYIQYDAMEGGNNPDTAGGMGGGGGGQGYTREFFPDTALFATGRTDQNGRATATFTLPDSLTSWRITAVAVDSQQLLAASSVQNVTASIPFFLDPLYATQYVEGDDVSFTARVFGREEITGTVEYTASIQGGDIAQTLTASGGASQIFNFGPLPQGEYTVTLDASWGEYQDSIALSFAVVESALSLPAQQVLDLSQAVELDALRYPVTLTFTDAQYATYSQVASYLANAGGTRADQQIAAQYARRILGMEEGQGVDLSDFVQWDGSVTYFPNRDDNNLLLTGKAAAAAPQMLTTDNTVSYLDSWKNSGQITQEEGAAAYMGLAALGEPVLDDLYQLIDLPDLDEEARLYLTAALGFAGDDAKAQEAYQQYVAPLLTRENGRAFLEDSRGRAATFERTARALMAASACRQKEDADLLARYLMENPSAYATGSLELLTYLRRFQPTQDTQARFSYRNSDGQRVTVDLAETPIHTAQFTKEGLEQAGFQVRSGQVQAVATYASASLTQDTQLLEGVTIEKTVENYEGGEIRPGTLLTVTLDVHFDPDAPYGYYQISDAIPSGARFVGVNDEMTADIAALDGEEGQTLSFTLWHAQPSDRYDLEEIRYQLERQLERSTAYEGDIILDRCGLTTDQAVALLAQDEGVTEEEIRDRYGLNPTGPGLRTTAAQTADTLSGRVEPSTGGGSLDEVPVEADSSVGAQGEGSFYDYRIVYQMRAATSGSYVVESAFLMEPSAGLAAASSRSTLQIQP